ncbi:MAG TPA: hypothetical protein VK181_04440 [Rhizobium sp.]|nr:hypothetical protein [Rhizobium sp.]
MNGEEKESVLRALMAAVVRLAFIGGCTVVTRDYERTRQVSACISNNMQWTDGSCTPIPKGVKP